MKTKTLTDETRHLECPDVMGCAYSQLNLEVESFYVEDGAQNVLVSPKVSPDEKSGEPVPRWTLIANPKTRKLLRVDFFLATDEGLEYPQYMPIKEQKKLFYKFEKMI